MLQFLSTITQFDNVNFLIFLFLTVVLYYVFRRSILFLLFASVFFYITFSYIYAIIILLLCLLTWGLGIVLAKESKKKKSVLIFSVISIVGILAYFRYASFIVRTVGILGIQLKIQAPEMIPLGISFFSFELLHYIIDVYRGKKAVRDIRTFLLFPFFFPTQIAGPIKRFESFAPQLHGTKISYEQLMDGILLLIKGFFKKFVLADTLAKLVIAGFDPTATPFITLLGIYAFSWQIYYDFSAYTDIGRGAAMLFNIHVPQNFNQPYLATNIRDFWKRWHISLMNWFLDYVYIPLGGNRKGKLRAHFNIFIVFAISGLWHGPAWHFVIWGIYHAALMIVYIRIEPLLKTVRKTVPEKFYTAVSIFITFNAVTLGWVLFRSPSVAYAVAIYKKILNISFPLPTLNTDTLIAIVLLTTYGICIYLLKQLVTSVSPLRKIGKYLIFGASIVITIIFLTENTAQFIYFQF